jgi:hypothetical protein
LEPFFDGEDVLEVTGEYTGNIGDYGTFHEPHPDYY